MKSIFITAIVLFGMISTAGFGQPSQAANPTTSMSPHEVRDLIKNAHSAPEYARLAGYFHQQEADYRAKAAAEKIERDRRAQVNAGLYQKYPRPVDTAQSLYDSYITSANSAAMQAKHFDDLAAAGQGHS